MFNIFFKGTKFEDRTLSGTNIECDIRSDWDSLVVAFDNTLLDIAELSNDR